MLKSLKKLLKRESKHASKATDMTCPDPEESKYLHLRQNSEITLIDSKSELDIFPVEIITIIAMYSGFFGAMNLRQTCRRINQILSIPYSWSQYVSRSPDVIHTQVVLDTFLHQFDQILFATWPMYGKSVPCIIHRTFLEQYDFLGGFSLIQRPSGMVTW